MAVRKILAARTPVADKARPDSVAAKIGAAPMRGAKPAAKEPAVVPEEAVSERTLVPGAPEAKKAAGGKRQRLSKAFSRPLDKKFKAAKPVRERFTLLDVEYAQLAVLKKRMSDQGMVAKKSDFIRAGLALVSVLDDAQLQALMAKVPPVG